MEGSHSSNQLSSEEVTSSKNGKKKWKAYSNNAKPPIYLHPNWNKGGLSHTQIRMVQRSRRESYQNFEQGGKPVHLTIKQKGDNRVTYHNNIGKSIGLVTRGEKAKSTKSNEENHVTDSFETCFPDDIEEICEVAMISVLPAKFADKSFGLDELEELFQHTQIVDEPSMIAYVPKWIVKTSSWNSAFFDKPTDQMRSHLKPLFIQAEVNGDFKVNKVLIDGGAAVNLMPESFLSKIDKTEKDLMDHNIVITDFNGVIPSTVHQVMILWGADDYVEYIDADDTAFKVASIGVLNSEKMLEGMGPCKVETFEQWKKCCGKNIKITLNPHNGFEINSASNETNEGQELASNKL
ncbi:hypothetical protein A2U01_0006000 [Trifolium medium]|uniref:Uncharacterized protein n=1 Tax=Trifolium medium TaxID=97028 RepID=A0A392MCH4_9FABA|nr:hypothetical protein [Trifolium medium]